VRRLKVLISAYACSPGKGSEPGAGWNQSNDMVRYHDVWVITRKKNREPIEKELAASNGAPRAPHPHFIYYDLPRWARWWKSGQRGVYLYYYLWQIGAYFQARRLHRKIKFDLAHHMTFGAYWMPTLLGKLGIPFVWGPVGGGESTPAPFRKTFPLRGRIYESIRIAAQCLAEHAPFVRQAARRSTIALTVTPETADRVRQMGAANIIQFEQVGLLENDIDLLSALDTPHEGFRLMSCGRLLHWKGFDLGLRAFAQAAIPNSEFWIVGDGPERASLESLARDLNIQSQVHFAGQLPRDATLRRMGETDVLVHPSLHESGGAVCVEAMAACKPVICINHGGPGVQVTAETGFAIPPAEPAQVVRDLAEAIRRLASDPDLRKRMGQAGRQRVIDYFCWTEKNRRLDEIYVRAVDGWSSSLATAVLRDRPAAAVGSAP
jgi:glycosyltransferase involved in cell wall biosynthesis